MSKTKAPARSSIDPVGARPEDDEDDEVALPDNRPQYKLTETAYIEDRICEAETLVRYEGIPGHHMKPSNAAAKAKVKELWPNGRPEYIDPISSMTVVGGMTEATETAKLIGAMAAQTALMTEMLANQKRA